MHLPPALARQFEGDRRDAADLVLGVDLGVESPALAVRLRLDAARLAEIDAAGRFAHDDHVEALQDLRLERRGVEQGVEGHRRAPVSEQINYIATAHKPGLRPRVAPELVPLRP